MGLFENLGRKVEEFKQEAQSVSEKRAVAECSDCGELLYTDRPDCPECGSDSLRPIRRGDGAESGPESAESGSTTDGTEPEDGEATADSSEGTDGTGVTDGVDASE